MYKHVFFVLVFGFLLCILVPFWLVSVGCMTKRKLRHRNELNATLMAMSISAKRVAYLAMIQLPFDEEKGRLIFEEDKTYKVSAGEYAEMCDVSTSMAYKQLKEGIRELRSTAVEIPKSHLGDDLDFKDEPDDTIVMFSLADYCSYSDGEGFVKLRFHRKMKFLIAELERKFTTQYLLSAVRLPIGNANNLYLLLREKIGEGKFSWFDITFDELKSKLMISSGGVYDSYMHFNNNFFKRSVRQVLDKTEFSKIEMEITERVNRKAHKLRISYAYTEQDKHQLDSMLKKTGNSKSENKENEPSKRALEMRSEVEKLNT